MADMKLEIAIQNAVIQ